MSVFAYNPLPLPRVLCRYFCTIISSYKQYPVFHVKHPIMTILAAHREGGLPTAVELLVHRKRTLYVEVDKKRTMISRVIENQTPRRWRHVPITTVKQNENTKFKSSTHSKLKTIRSMYIYTYIPQKEHTHRGERLLQRAAEVRSRIVDGGKRTFRTHDTRDVQTIYYTSKQQNNIPDV